MSWYTKLVANGIFPIHERLKKHNTVEIKNAMEASQWWSREQILDFQDLRLQKLMHSVYEHVPYYKKVFDQLEIKPNDIKSVADLAKLPFLTKTIIRENSDDLRADNAGPLARFNTGGSSGEPLVFFIGNERVSHDVAAKWRATRWWDVDIGDKEIVLWGSPIELGSQDYIRLVRDQLLRTKLLPAFEMTSSKLDDFVEAIIKTKPAMLFGYPSAFCLIVEHAEKRGISFRDLGIKVVFVTSERLYDHQRETIETAFACPVANGYGGRDAGFIAHQCPQGSMHITAEDIVVEIIDTEGNVLPTGQTGEIVITHLATREYPFLRYRTGDIAALSEETCACGRGLPLLKDLQGRSTDFIVALDGTIMHGLALIYVIRDLNSVEEFKIIQETQTTTRVLLVPNKEFNAQQEALIVSGFKQRLGEDVDIVVEQVKEIPAERSGKMRYVVSHVEANS